jgi:3-oxoadipate enol-lactonase
MWDERIAQARSEGLASIARTTIARWTTQDFAERDPDIVDSLIAEFAATPIAGYVGCCEFLRDTDMTPHLEKISVPTLVIAGAEDAASPLAASTELRDAIPGATLEVIPRAGHLSNIEQPQGYNEVLAEFFGETASE